MRSATSALLVFASFPALAWGDPHAARIGLKAHADAAALQKLPRFDYQARTRWGFLDAMRAEDQAGLPELTRALDGELSRKPGEARTWFDFGFAWDETHFITDTRTHDSGLGSINTVFGTRTDSWHRSEAGDHSSRSFTRRAGIGLYWRDGPDSGFIHLESSYLRFTPLKCWWGESHRRTSQALTHQPLAGASWTMLPAGPFAGEPCHVVEASGRYGRFQRLWVGQESGRVRGVLTFLSGPDQPNALVRFDDYREVAAGVWVPFAEAHVFAWGSRQAKDKLQLLRSERRVTTVRTGVSLAARYAALLPQAGDRVQDQRFATAVNTRFDPARPDADIQREADAELARQLKDAELVKALTEPMDRLVGKPAPALPADGWVGGTRPDLTGKPHLIHFWATWCGPCKNDLPMLKSLAAAGLTVVGVHPSGTPAEEVSKVVAEQKLNYPTLVATEPGRESVAGYPVRFYPYCVAVDGRGNVSAHGTLQQVLRSVGQSPLEPVKP